MSTIKWLFRFRFFDFRYFFTGQRIGIDQWIFTALYQSWLSGNTGYDRLLIVPVTWIWPVFISRIMFGTFKLQQWFGTAAHLIRPIATFNSFIIEQAMWLTLSTFRYAPRTFTVENITWILFIFRKETKLPWTTGCWNWFG